MKIPSEIIGENLSLLSEDTMKFHERRFLQLKELAVTVAKRNFLFDSDSPSEDFNELFKSFEAPPESAVEAAEYLRAFDKDVTLKDKLTVCKYLSAEAVRRGKSPITRLLDSSPYGDNVKISYFKNAYADAAFMEFSKILKSPSVIYASDFSAACEEVYYGRADMCMLPLDSSRDAKLISFYRLIDKYELHPVLSCDITTPDGNITTRYALLRSQISIPTAEEQAKERDCFFEFTIVPDKSGSLDNVLLAARECGLTIYKIDSLPLSYSDREFSCDLLLKVGDMAGLEAFVMFLHLVFPQYEPLGIYTHICS